MDGKTVLLIMGSVRSGRLCPRIATWIEQIGRASTDLSFEVIDLAKWKLPMDDEPALPHSGHYTQQHTREWSDKIQSSAACVFVTPQYNWGYPAVLKNSIDHLYTEWRGKPLMIVTYGGHGGGQAGIQLRNVVGRLKMRIAETSPGLVLPDAVIKGLSELDPENDFANYKESIEKAFAELMAIISS